MKRDTVTFKQEKYVLDFIAGLEKKMPKYNSFDQSVPPLFSLAKLEIMSRGDHTFIKKMIEIFIEKMPVCLYNVREAYDQKDFKKLAAILHKIKPTVYDMDIDPLKEIMKELTFLINNEPASDKMPLLLNTVENIIFKVTCELENIIEQ